VRKLIQQEGTKRSRNPLQVKAIAILLAVVLAVTPLAAAAIDYEYIERFGGDIDAEWYTEADISELDFQQLHTSVADEPPSTGISLTANQEAWLDLINYDNVVEMAQRLTRYPFGSRVGGSFRMDMTVDYLMDTLSSWGYDPWIHEFDTRGPRFMGIGAAPQVSNLGTRFNNGWVEVGGSRFMLYGPGHPAHAAVNTFLGGGAQATVYNWVFDSANNYSITANGAGSVFLEWPSIPFRGNMNIGNQGGLPTIAWGEVASDYYVPGGPTAANATAAFAGTFLAENGVGGVLDPAINVAGRVVFVQLGSGATPHVRGVWHPSSAQIHETVLLLQNAGAAAVVFQSRPARAGYISQFTPFYNIRNDRSTWTVGDSVHGRLANQASGAQITIPVGLTTHWETNEPFRALVGSEPVTVHMQTRSDGQNVLAEWTSSNPDAKNIYLGTHPDSVVSAPGFNDNILTTALLMEFMRVLAEYEIELDHNIRFGAWDFEENGLLGARYYVWDMTAEDQEAFWGNFNLDMIATGQPECIYMHINITTPLFAQADATNIAAGSRPVGNLQFYLREIRDNERLRDHPDALAYANQFDVWANSLLAVLQLADDGRHEHRQIVVDPSHHRYGEPFCVDYHFTFTWGQTTDQAAFVQPALDGHRHANLKNAMQFDWRANARGFVGGQFPTGWQPGDGAPSPALTTLGIMPVLEILYHTMGDTYELNFCRDRMEVMADIIWLAIYHSAGVQTSLADGIVVTPIFLTEDAQNHIDVYIQPGELAWSASVADLTAAETRITPEVDGTFIVAPGWHTVFHRAGAPYTADFHMVQTFFYVPADTTEMYMPIENSRRNPAFQGVSPASGIRHVGETHAGGTAAAAIIRLPAICDRNSPGGNWSVSAAERDSDGNRLPGQTWALGSDLAPWDPNNFNTPAMRNMEFDENGMLIGLADETRSLYAFTTLAEMLDFYNELLVHPVNGSNMYRFNAGWSPHNFAHISDIEHFQNDFVVFTTTNLNGVTDWREAGELVRNNGKPTFFTFTGIHGHELSSQEGALALLHALATTQWGVEVLQDINIVAYLGVNASGNYQMNRRMSHVPYPERTANGLGQRQHDGNRDFVLQHTQENRQLHQVWLAFMPEVTADGHEIGGVSYGTDGWIRAGAMGDDHQLQLTATKDVDSRVVSLGSDILARNFSDGKDAGVRIAYYNVMIVNASVGNHFYGMWGGISMIFETRGQSSQNIMRRAYATYVSYRSIIEFMRENAEEIHDTIADVRADLVEGGRTYSPIDPTDSTTLIVRDQQGGSVTEAHRLNYADTRMPFASRWIVGRGGQYELHSDQWPIATTRAVQLISRPTAYVVPMEIDWETHSNVQANPANPYAYAVRDLRIMLANHGVEYYILEAGATLPLQQFYVSSATVVPRDNAFETGLRERVNVSFDVPVLFIPMDQVAGHIIGQIMTPDMRVAMREGATTSLSWVQSLQTGPAQDTSASNGTSRMDQTRTLLNCQVTRNLPVFRLIEDNPREVAGVVPPIVFTGNNPNALKALLAERDVALQTAGNLGIFTHHSPFVIPEGRTLTVVNTLNVQGGAELIVEGRLVVEEGGRINNQGGTGGTIVIRDNGVLVNNGHVENVTNSEVMNYGTIVNNARFEIRAGTRFHSCYGEVIETTPLNIHRNAIICEND